MGHVLRLWLLGKKTGKPNTVCRIGRSNVFCTNSDDSEGPLRSETSIKTISRSQHFYRPQTKFAKVMFLHLFISHSVHRGSPTPGEVPPGQVYPPGVTPREGTPPAGTTPRQVQPPPRPQYMLGYGQQAGDTHPTGMHSCNECCLIRFFVTNICLHSGFLFPLGHRQVPCFFWYRHKI